MPGARAVATCGALALVAALSREASAAGPGRGEDDTTGFSERGRLFGGLTHEARGSTKIVDYWVGVTPELLFRVVEPRWQLRSSLSTTASAHTVLANDLATRLALGSMTELSRRATLVIGAEANHTTISSFLFTRSQAATPVGILPASNLRLVTASISEAIGWEASPVVRLEERVDASVIRSLGDDANIYGRFVNLTLGAERSWKVNAVGVEAHAGYANARSRTLERNQELLTLSTGTRLRHDFSPTVTGSVMAGPAMVVGLDDGTRPKLTPAVRANLLHFVDASTIDLVYEHGFTPNVLTGQVLRAHQATLRAGVPLSERERVVAGASLGWLHAAFVDLSRDAPSTREFDAALGDVDLGWRPVEWLTTFARYQIIAQTRGVTTTGDTALTRQSIILGIQLSTTTPERATTAFRAPQRVDRSDIR
jgi:hypothetical protein